PSLAGMTWNKENPFTRSQKLFIKRAKIDIKIVLKESDDKAKYELFMRLNTGGTALEPQEVRNCLMIMAYPKSYKWVKDLSDEQDFRNATPLSDQSVSQQYPMELVTRFLIFRQLPEAALSEVGDIGDFLNDRLGDLESLRRTRQAAEEKAFRETFRFIH